MENNWILKEDELPSAYEEIEVLLTDNNIRKDMIIRGEDEILQWKNSVDRDIKAWRYY